MTTSLSFDIRRQPDVTTCGPTCLHALYRYYGDSIELDDVIARVSPWQKGGTLAVYLAIHAIRRGYGATILPYNLTVFDPTWRDIGSRQMARKLEAQLLDKKGLPGFEEVTHAYLEYLALGGRIQFRVLTPALIRKYLKAGIPILTGLSATYLYDCPREREHNGGLVYDDVRGDSCGHFVVLSGYNKESRRVRVADPLVPNPIADGRYYDVDIYRLVCAIMLGILTYDGNMLIIKKSKHPPAKGRRTLTF
ncbi:MAG: C39 family peptidase [Deltaproteobacteria bacterium]|jgi:hypothetical protein|nr:C39 family peptidase [Deltaproteobacteria bacterium]